MTALFPPLARAAAERVPVAWAVQCVVPVPLHPARRRERGFDQGALIAAVIASQLGVPVRDDLIRRSRRTQAQASLGRDECLRNVAGAFAPRPAQAVPDRALLVDDVTTTGATLEAAATALRAAGVGSVVAITLAIED